MNTESPSFFAYDAFKAQSKCETEKAFWLSDFINPEMIRESMKHRRYASRPPKWDFLGRLLAEQAKQRPELDPKVRTRLNNLIAILRVAVDPDTNKNRQDLIHRLLSEASAGTSSFGFVRDAREDLQWMQDAFNPCVSSK